MARPVERDRSLRQAGELLRTLNRRPEIPEEIRHWAEGVLRQLPRGMVVAPDGPVMAASGTFNSQPAGDAGPGAGSAPAAAAKQELRLTVAPTQSGPTRITARQPIHLPDLYPQQSVDLQL